MLKIPSTKHFQDYFTNMAKGKVPVGNVHVLNQKGRGLGNSRRGKIIYKISQSGSGSADSKIVSPIQQSLDQAVSQVNKEKGIKRKRGASAVRSTKRRRRSNTSKKKGSKKKKRKPKKVKKKTTKKKKKGKKRAGKKKTKKRKGKKDIFS